MRHYGALIVILAMSVPLEAWGAAEILFARSADGETGTTTFTYYVKGINVLRSVALRLSVAEENPVGAWTLNDAFWGEANTSSGVMHEGNNSVTVFANRRELTTDPEVPTKLCSVTTLGIDDQNEMEVVFTSAEFWSDGVAPTSVFNADEIQGDPEMSRGRSGRTGDSALLPMYFAASSRIPASNEVLFRLDLGRASNATLAVYDVHGRRVKTVVERALEAGSHRFIWDCRDASGRSVEPGLYFGRLTTAESSITRKLVVVQ